MVMKLHTDDWPCIGLPDAILADRGELLGHQIEALEYKFSIRIENTSALSWRFKTYCRALFQNYSGNI